ncbi:HD domain-containing protein [Quadrisphaera sp. INWT6]|uniref:HD domain-containing protein n=1 Tax=Quadrisphaera sp. INWT6 TaxID=2596917 RepID=UPI00189273A4|nr:HD domain-containing protein [Quadrisphaera sp. INWT6]
MSGQRPVAFTRWSPLHSTADRLQHAAPARCRIDLLDAPENLTALDGALVDQARRVARELLATVDDAGRRWRHTQAVAARAREGSAAVAPQQVNLLISAAWLHDIGYAPALARTGFHPVDGAMHLQQQLWPPAVVGLVAHHSGSRFVAAVREVQHHMIPFERVGHWSGPVADALTWADQTTGPDGNRVSVHERIAEVLSRHGADSPQARCHPQRGPALINAVNATEDRLLLARAAGTSSS